MKTNGYDRETDSVLVYAQHTVRAGEVVRDNSRYVKRGPRGGFAGFSDDVWEHGAPRTAIAWARYIVKNVQRTATTDYIVRSARNILANFGKLDD